MVSLYITLTTQLMAPQGVISGESGEMFKTLFN